MQAICIDLLLLKLTTLKSTLFTLSFFAIFVSCNDLYKAGNLVDLSYPINTSLRTKIVKRYIDTLIQSKGFAVPDKWQQFDKLVDLDSINNKRIYFASNPEEMYLISYGGMLTLSDVYNPRLNQNDWVADRDRMPKSEELRIMKRFKEILNTIDAMAHRDNLLDSVIYK